MNSQRRFAAPHAASRALHTLSLLAACAGLTLCARTAHADVSSWVFVGGGVSELHQRELSSRAVGAMRVQFGLGTDPSHPLVLGGLFSFEPNFGYGSDLALLVRGATRGYVNGGFGLALDAGPYERFWGEGSVGGAGTLWLGAPWGVSLGLGGSVGSNEASGFSAILGIDFARLTVYRNTGTSWFPNPFPAYRATPER
ncbi:MAG TPA: hypothetical protein VHW01_26555 [Polyangiaceae bacterium]|nr:hypothetical protein [Polyangiaceae bacterium]